MKLIGTIVFGLFLAYFATQNTSEITLRFFEYTTPVIPIYVVIIGAFLFGLCLFWISSIIKSIGLGLALRGKENAIRDYRKEHAELTKRIHQLELENTRLKSETHAPVDDKSL